MLPLMALAEGTDVTTAVSTLLEIGTSVMNWIQGNALLSLCFAGCIIPIGFRVIRKALHTVR